MTQRHPLHTKPLARASLALAVSLLAACHPARAPGPLAADASTYPFTLLSPALSKHDFMVRQNVTIAIDAHGEVHRGTMDVVLQKQGDALLIVGLGPMNTRAFVVEYKDGNVRYERTSPAFPDLPIAPRALVVDIERVYFATLPAPPDGYSGTLSGVINDEHVTERWAGGSLQRRTFSRRGFPAPIVIDFGPGYTTKKSDPHRIVLRNPWLGYEATIAGDDAETLD